MTPRLPFINRSEIYGLQRSLLTRCCIDNLKRPIPTEHIVSNTFKNYAGDEIICSRIKFSMYPLTNTKLIAKNEIVLPGGNTKLSKNSKSRSF